MLSRLLERGLFAKKKDPADGRRMLLTLTDKGRRVHSDIDKISIELYSSWLKHIPMRDRA
ncbi:winged helix DNA-binding protein, partial [bacterium]|nr:winged helix DNA-binding protein [bacterium]